MMSVQSAFHGFFDAFKWRITNPFRCTLFIFLIEKRQFHHLILDSSLSIVLHDKNVIG